MCPYGIPNEKKDQTTWMENCVNSVMEKGDKDKSAAIAICKANLKKNGWKVPKKAESEVSFYQAIKDFENKFRKAFLGDSSTETVQSGPWLEDIYDTYAIVSKDGGYWRVPYTVDGDEFIADWGNASQVERNTYWEPVATSNKIPPIARPKNDGRIITYGGHTVN